MPNDLLSGVHEGRNDFPAREGYSKEDEIQNNLKANE
jgi:hypothetical protein